MPALPNVPGVVKIVVQQSLASVNVNNVLHANGPNITGYTESELNALAAAVRTAWVTNVIPLQDQDLTLGEVLAIDLSSDTGGTGRATGSTAGSNVGTSISANAAVVWSWKIANRYRGGHPRTYIGGLNVGMLSNANTFTTSYVTSQLNAASALRAAVNGTAIGGASWVLGCVSYYADKALRQVPQFRPFQSVTVDSRVDSQRRRLGRDR